jgi:CBS domain-containing protein
MSTFLGSFAMPVTSANHARASWAWESAPIVGYIQFGTAAENDFREEHTMKVSDILRVKGNTLFTITPDDLLAEAVKTMAEKDIGSLVVMEHGDLVGMLTFREVIVALVDNGGQVGGTLVRKAMDDAPVTCTLETELDEIRRIMLERHARYMPVMDKRMLMGVISFYDVAKAVVDSQNFENKMLKAYIRDWPEEQ